MKNGFTLLEMLIVLLLLSCVFVITLPSWQNLREQQHFNQELSKLQLFLRRVQMRVANSQEIWLLIANRDLVQKRWCLTAQRKVDNVCDCLNPNSCSQDTTVLFYYPQFSHQTMLISKFYYPREISRLSGIRDTLETACFILQLGNQRAVFSLFNVGSIKLKRHKSFSACENKEV
ncbi:prepilin-type N-terminal cleavage/methylation domain-containing protein [Pasteurella oralis]|uniref:Prepilin-type N-terminal cleavage/methylation domain-containing protein n=1 Tax=Pasteurella oralis TaxID=1071947 RepID=A0ABW4NUQ5_9PAST|nr:prepilin-type N-terminal cleavage/methylation domain-containing protein [Pasteurella oralis]MDO5055652.1 prepilin-type N-terminal cleavage/methylation domain-containing protein [Pasteurella oralis]